MPSKATAGRTFFPPFCRNQAVAKNAMNAGIPLFQAFSPIPVQESTYCDCIKDGGKIEGSSRECRSFSASRPIASPKKAPIRSCLARSRGKENAAPLKSAIAAIVSI